MGKTTDIRSAAASVYLLPLRMRTPLKFGLETVTDITCARVCMTVVDAQIPHVLLAAYAGTVMGLDTNSMQYYPEASALEALVHPGLYRRRGGKVDLSTIGGPGFGYRLAEIKRDLPPPAVEFIDPHFP